MAAPSKPIPISEDERLRALAVMHALYVEHRDLPERKPPQPEGDGAGLIVMPERRTA